MCRIQIVSDICPPKEARNGRNDYAHRIGGDAEIRSAKYGTQLPGVCFGAARRAADDAGQEGPCHQPGAYRGGLPPSRAHGNGRAIDHDPVRHGGSQPVWAF